MDPTEFFQVGIKTLQFNERRTHIFVFVIYDVGMGLVLRDFVVLSALDSQSMWYQNILIELLTVLFLLQPHIYLEKTTCINLILKGMVL